jgi:SAM-dependent methyltransferase
MAGSRGRTNRQSWDHQAAEYERRHASRLGGSEALAWGFWRIPESSLRLLGDVRGRDLLELGCGAARWSAGLARRGASVVALDLSRTRLEQARPELRGVRRRARLVQANAERLPFPASSFDGVFSDWGGMTFADPAKTVPEVARILRPGGVLAFATSSPLRETARNRTTDRLEPKLWRPYFRTSGERIAGTWEYSLPYGGWVELFGRHGLGVERLVETRPPPGRHSSYLSRSDERWASRWPIEVLWQVRKVNRGNRTNQKA